MKLLISIGLVLQVAPSKNKMFAASFQLVCGKQFSCGKLVAMIWQQ